MANMKQQIKRYKNDNQKRAKNTSYKSAVKAYNEVASKLDASVVKGIHHRNYASRQKSRLAKLVNSI